MLDGIFLRKSEKKTKHSTTKHMCSFSTVINDGMISGVLEGGYQAKIY